LHARKHAELKRWVTITELRVGEDLQLFSEQQLPLTKDRLAAALGDRGPVIERTESPGADRGPASHGANPSAIARRSKNLISLTARSDFSDEGCVS
jgi:hypothetical protein